MHNGARGDLSGPLTPPRPERSPGAGPPLQDCAPHPPCSALPHQKILSGNTRNNGTQGRGQTEARCRGGLRVGKGTVFASVEASLHPWPLISYMSTTQEASTSFQLLPPSTRMKRNRH